MVGVRKFDRRFESQNKAKNRMKSYMNRGKSVNNSRLNGGSNSNIFTTKDMRSGFANMVGGVFGSGFGAQESNFQTSGTNT